mmetsp:Transcript_7909/g.17318  ORF Transcript_7909/g.17318 Transcript_7909/m.17318 type:complete len:203 (-) Transcript_7909:216-824(-)
MSIVDFVDACNFAAQKHVNQRRKGDDSPYINHTIGVAHILTLAGISDVDILKAAVLHDTVEDTDTSIEELYARFGEKVGGIVKQVSDDKSLSKVERKKHQVTHAANVSVGARLVKLADKLYNCQDIITSPPKGWSMERAQGYFVWSKKVVDQLKGLNEYLDDAFSELWRRTFEFQGKTYPVLPQGDLDQALQQYYNHLLQSN